MKRLFALIAATVTFFTLAPTKVEAGPHHGHFSFRVHRGPVHRAPVRYYGNRYVRPAYNNYYQPRYSGGYHHQPVYRPVYRPTPYYNRGYYNPGYYNAGYNNCGNYGPSVSINTRFGSFTFR